MKRREVLRRIGLGGAGGLLLPSARAHAQIATPRATIVAVPTFLLPTMPDGWNVNPPAFNAIVNNNADGMAQGYVIRCPKAGTLDKFEFRTAASGAGATNGLRVSFQGVSATGFPVNIQSQYRNVPGASLPDQSWIVPGLMTSDGTDGGTKRTVAVGELLGVVIEYVTFVAGNNFQIGQVNYSPLVDEGYAGEIGLCTRNAAGGAWSFRNGLGFTMALKYADGTYAQFTNPRYYPYQDFSSATFNVNSTPGDEYGLRFKLPCAMRINGFWVRANFGTTPTQVVLYDAADAVVATSTMPGYAQKLGSYIPIAEVTLAAGVVYRLTVKPTTTTNISLYYLQVSTPALLGATPEGVEFYMTNRLNGAGAWTDQPTYRPWMGLSVNGIDTAGAAPACASGGMLPYVGE